MAHVILIVDGNTVFDNASPDQQPSIIPQEISVRYNEPRELKIQGLYPFPGDFPVGWDESTVEFITLFQSAIELYIDDILRFKGKAYTVNDNMTPQGRNLSWVCYGPMEEARTLRVRNTAGACFFDKQWNLLELANEAGILGQGVDASQIVWPTVKNSIETLFATPYSDEFVAKGIPTDFTGRLSEVSFGSLQLENVTITDVMDRLMEATPGTRYLIDPANDQWIFVDVLSPDEPVDLNLGEDVVPSFSPDVSVKNRYTAVSLMGTEAEEGFEIGFGQCTRGWSLSSEATWSLKDEGITGNQMGQGVNQTAMQQLSTSVGKFWTFPPLSGAIVDDPNLGAFTRIMTYVDGSETGFRYFRQEIDQIDLANGYLMLKRPVLHVNMARRYKANAFAPGNYRAPDLFLRYKYKVTTQTFWGARAPAEGFSGAAANLGVENEYRAITGHGGNVQNTIADMFLGIYQAEEMLKSLSGLNISSTTPVAGDVGASLWNLGKRMNVSAIRGHTSYEGVAAIITGFTHTFDKGGMTNYNWTTDLSSFMRWGSV